MNPPGPCGIVIPCLNEAASIERVVTEARAHVPAIVVVDDGSSDQTGERAEASGATVLRHAASRGKGAALATGLKWLRDRGFAWALTMDGDGQHAPKDIPTLLECARATGAALVVGNRMENPATMPWLRRRVNEWMSRRLSKLSRQYLPDSQCGFRLMELETWAGLALKTEHFEIESELLVGFVAAGRRVEFVPVQVIYKREQSKIHPARDTIRWLRWWWRASRKIRPTARAAAGNGPAKALLRDPSKPAPTFAQS